VASYRMEKAKTSKGAVESGPTERSGQGNAYRFCLLRSDRPEHRSPFEDVLQSRPGCLALRGSVFWRARFGAALCSASRTAGLPTIQVMLMAVKVPTVGPAIQ
jgi:hypothetical protein